jgi:hypothetical protein
VTIWKLFDTDIKARTTRDSRKQQHSSISTKSPTIGVLYVEILQALNRLAQVTQIGSSALHKSRQRTLFSRRVADLDRTCPVHRTRCTHFISPPKTRAKERPRSNAWFMGPAELEMIILLWTAAK